MVVVTRSTLLTKPAVQASKRIVEQLKIKLSFSWECMEIEKWEGSIKMLTY